MIEITGDMQAKLLAALQQVGVKIFIDDIFDEHLLKVGEKYRLFFPEDGAPITVAHVDQSEGWSALEYKGVRFIMRGDKYLLMKE